MIKKITRSSKCVHVGDVIECTTRGRGIVDEIYVGNPLQAFVVWDHDRSSSLVNLSDIEGIK